MNGAKKTWRSATWLARGYTKSEGDSMTMLEPEGAPNPWEIAGLFIAVSAILVAIGVCMGGCSLARYVPDTETVGGTETAEDPCEAIDQNYIGWTITASIAGAGATATTIAGGLITDRDAIVGLGVTSVGLAAIATAAGFIAAEYAARYEACRNETQGEW